MSTALPYEAWRASFQCPEHAAQTAYQMFSLVSAILAKAEIGKPVDQIQNQRRTELPQ